MEKISLSNRTNHRYFAPKKKKEISERKLKYSDAVKLAKDINFNENERFHVIVSGTFFFGDFIEAFIVNYNIHVRKLTISTLSMNRNNVDSLFNLINGNYVDELDLVLSDYFFAHERNDLVPYIYERLDIDNKLQLSFAGTHCKICLIETHNDRFFVFHGSANLRSSSNIEQICLEENKDLYLWYNEIQQSIVEEYKTINKSIRGNKLWQKVTNQEKVADVQDVRVVQEQADAHQLGSLVKQTQALRFNKIKF